jgi:capsular polysaccharide export protein
MNTKRFREEGNMSDVVFIAGKSKSAYFQRAAVEVGGRFIDKKGIRRYSYNGLWQAFFNLKREDVSDISGFYLQLKRRKKSSLVYRLLLRLRVRLYFARYITFFTAIEENYFALWNGYYLGDKALVLAGERCGKKPIYFENGLMPRTTTVDLKGVNFANSLPRDAEFFRGLQIPENYILGNTLIKRPLACGKIIDQPISLPRRYIFIPFQVESDTQVVIYGGWIKSMRKLYLTLFNVIERIDDPDLVFVVKEHPSSLSNYDDLKLQQSKRLVFANGNDTEELIAGAEAIVTINSTVGIEALMLQKKVITLGMAFYSIRGLVLHANTEAQLIAMLDNLKNWTVDGQLLTKFLWYLGEHYLVKGSWRNPDAEHFKSLSQKLTKL